MAGNLVRDLAALNKVEVLPWDDWRAHPTPDADLTDDQLALFDELAGLTADPDASFSQLRDRYRAVERLRVRPDVFNFLRKRHERVG